MSQFSTTVENPFSVFDSLLVKMKGVDPFDMEARAAIAKKVNDERLLLKSCGFDVVTRTYCEDCH